ncbi:hypothetical protein MHBO_000846 [Bonamia ostreae]|uniref:Nucleolus and neural progenitor protein-like N-terminal domain-containing protein n=1 Tax=Bonamia ostreae TaxID=126728 RepID=A0ABV2AH27_9EUKA
MGLTTKIAGMKTGADFFSLEAAILKRLLYKTKNQHRRAIYYRKLQHVLKLSLQTKCLVYEILMTICKCESVDELEKIRKMWNVTEATIFKLSVSVKNATINLISLIERTFFLPVAITSLAICSRIYFLSESFKPKMQNILKELDGKKSKAKNLELKKRKRERSKIKKSTEKSSETIENIFSNIFG